MINFFGQFYYLFLLICMGLDLKLLKRLKFLVLEMLIYRSKRKFFMFCFIFKSYGSSV